MWPFPILARWQRRRHRAIDRAVLFPLLRTHQTTWERGTQAILQHVRTDEAWAMREEWAGEPVESPEQKDL